jgi:hypothetical protein
MKLPRVPVAGAAGILCLVTPLAAHPADGPPQLPVRVLERAIDVAGFDDPAWQGTPAASDTTQQEPEEGKPATRRTTCRVIATPKALALLFFVEQPAEEIVAHELRRDSDLSSDDRLSFVLDTNHDRRNAYYFATNANGVRTDGLVTEQADPSLDWDTVWDVRVRKTAGGWEALFTIPFASLTFPGERGGVWGFNFMLETRRRGEIARWTGWKRPWRFAEIQHEGDLTDLPAMPSRRLREVTPYVSGALDVRNGAHDTDLLGKAGFDARYGVTSAVEADLTVNTDFAETEADAQQFNFGRTSLFFPEKRAFFLQRSQIFAFGDKDTTIPFFSRRIGLSDAGPIPIDAGLKVTGRAGATEFGALAVQTRADRGEPRTDFLVGRVKQDVGHSTYVGALFTDVERATGSGLPGHSRTYGLDTGITFSPEWRMNAYWIDTSTPGLTGKTSAWSADLFYTGETFRGELQRAHFGGSYDAEIGFVAQTGVSFWYGQLGVTLRPKILGLRQVTLDVYTFPKDNEDGTPNERNTAVFSKATWQSGAYVDVVAGSFLDENLTSPLSLGGHSTVAPGRYRFVRHQIDGSSDPSRTLAVSFNVRFGGYYDGHLESYAASLAWKPSSHVALSVSENYNVVRLPGGNFDLSLFSARLDWNPSNHWLSSIIIQSDNLDRLTDIQAIVRWLAAPGTDVFAVYDRQTGAGFENPGTRVTLKVRRTFDF